jgi:choline-glycine betaine transporter
MYHYGFAGWSPYLIVGIAAGIAAYRFDMPLTIRSTMYEVFGAYTWGWIGDVVDGFSIVMTVAGKTNYLSPCQSNYYSLKLLANSQKYILCLI